MKGTSGRHAGGKRSFPVGLVGAGPRAHLSVCADLILVRDFTKVGAALERQVELPTGQRPPPMVLPVAVLRWGERMPEVLSASASNRTLPMARYRRKISPHEAAQVLRHSVAGSQATYPAVR